ncbi:MAG: 1-deoxy-D-xylulose-5-phosphate reductoisomerase [Planctomycetes bacterium]|nr:1-deoxy-D-xylulose-5-phosphate reductoisomerase [Planctomycetota bacterium]
MTALHADAPVRRLIVLGSTGSIGTSTMEVVRRWRDHGGPRMEVVGLAAHSNVALLAKQAAEFGVRHVAAAVPSDPAELAGFTVFTGEHAARDLIQAIARPGDLVLAAMVGAAGIAPTLAAIDAGCDIALANKETLVAAGELVMARIRERRVALLPVDSEHSGVFQCLGERPTSEVARIVLTASGGPFRTWDRVRMASITLADALKHPTWTMGRKVTIDSATMMNKGLELLEAHWLFGVGRDRLGAIVHPQSMVHAMVEFIDGSVVAQISPPDMRLPIQIALAHPRRVDGPTRRVDWAQLGSFQFEPIDHERFPAPGLALDAIGRGGTAGCTLNAANEIAVQGFIDGRLPFMGIAELVGECMAAMPCSPASSLDAVLTADAAAREWCMTRLGRSAALRT